MREMKSSGIEWIGEIPKEWNIIKIKYATESRNEKGLFNPETDRYIGLDNVRGYSNELFASDSQYEESVQSICCRNDVMFGKLRPYLAKVIISPIDGFCTGEFLQIKEYRGDRRFLRYFLLAPGFIDMVNASTYGTKMPRANSEFILNSYMIYPSGEEQKLIADFLDRKCSEIDSLTADIEEQIATLEQYKRSVITEAVTKGLDPDAEMKESGIEWIGDIPAAWNVHPVYYYFGERKNKNSLGQEKNLLSLSYGNIIWKDINSDGGLLPESFNTYNIVEDGDIIIRPTDLQNDKHSLRTGLVKEHGIITSAYIALRPIKPVNTAYFHYLLHAYDVMKVFYNMGNGVRQGLNFSEFSKLMVFEPSREEQDAIVDYLDRKCAEIDSIVADKKSQLDALVEYKKSLIYEYVTGKKEVPTYERHFNRKGISEIHPGAPVSG